ncbi:hypothetical protein [Streptodolium elevatio]
MAEPSSSEASQAASAGLSSASPEPEPVPLAYAAPYPADPPSVLARPMNAYVSGQLKAGADPADLGLRPPAQADRDAVARPRVSRPARSRRGEHPQSRAGGRTRPVRPLTAATGADRGGTAAAVSASRPP